jgi:hypothetical protein
MRLKKDMLIDLYWILDAVQKGMAPNAVQAGRCFVAVRDALMQPDTEDIVAHIHGALAQSQAAADVLTDQAIGQAIDQSRQAGPAPRVPLPAPQLQAWMASLAPDLPPELAVAFGRQVEAAHGITG